MFMSLLIESRLQSIWLEWRRKVQSTLYAYSTYKIDRKASQPRSWIWPRVTPQHQDVEQVSYMVDMRFLKISLVDDQLLNGPEIMPVYEAEPEDYIIGSTLGKYNLARDFQVT